MIILSFKIRAHDEKLKAQDDKIKLQDLIADIEIIMNIKAQD